MLPQVLSYSHEAPSSSEFYPVSLQSILLDLSKYLFLPVKKSSTYKRAFSDCQGLKKYSTLQPGIEKAAGSRTKITNRIIKDYEKFAPRHLGSSQTRGHTRVPCTGRRCLPTPPPGQSSTVAFVVHEAYLSEKSPSIGPLLIPGKI